MSRPVVGIISNSHLINDEYLVQGAGAMNVRALSKVSGVVPLIIPVDPELLSVDELMSTCDGFFLPGGRPNVHPEEYGEEETAAHGTFERNRDRST